MITVRVATPEDSEAILEVSNLAVAILRKTYLPKKAVQINRPHGEGVRTRLVALVDDRVVGTVQYAERGDGIHLIGLFVHPQFQRQGIAHQLVQFMVDVGRQNEARCLSVNTVKETGNVQIFRRLGFEVIFEAADQRSESDIYEQLTDVYMEMQIERSLPR